MSYYKYFFVMAIISDDLKSMFEAFSEFDDTNLKVKTISLT